MSYQSPETRTLLATFEQGYLELVRIGQIVGGWRTFLDDRNLTSGEASEGLLREFIEPAVGEMIRNVAAERLMSLVVPGFEQLREIPDIDFKALIVSGNRAFQSEPMDTEAFALVVAEVFGKLNDIGPAKRAVSQYLSVIRRGENYLKALRNAVEQFILDPTVGPKAFKSMADRKRFADRVCVDLDADTAVLATLRGDLVVVDSALNDMRETLLRVDSAMRMFSKQEGDLWAVNGRQSTRRTTRPAGV